MSTSNGRQLTQPLNKYDSCCFSGSASAIYVPAVKKFSKIQGGNFKQFINLRNTGHGIHIDSAQIILNKL